MRIPVDTVYGASRYQQKVTQAPASVSIVTASEIRKYGYRSLPEVLRSIRGLYVSSDRNYYYLGTRGVLRPGDYNTRVLLLIDGHRMNDNVYDAADLDTVVNVESIDRVEFIRGPSSSIYGSSAFFGVINVITKQGVSEEGGELGAAAGSLQSYRLHARWNESFQNELALSLAGSYFTSRGHDNLYFPEFDRRLSSDPRATVDGVASDIDAERSARFAATASRDDLTLTTVVSKRSKQVPTASFGTVFNDGREETIDTRAYVDIKYERGSTDTWQLLGRAFYDWYRYEGAYPYDDVGNGDPADISISRDDTYGEWLGAALQLTGKVRDRHTLLFGGELRENIRQDQAYYEGPEPQVTTLDDHRDSRILALFAQTEIALRSNLALTGGVRYDEYFDGFGSTLNPRLALIYNPAASTTLKALYGEAFRAPNPYERFYTPPPQELEPETIRTYELVLEHYFATRYMLSVSGYRYKVNDLIAQVAADDEITLFFANVEAAKTEGVEMELEGSYRSGLTARASYSLQKAEDLHTGERLSNSPRHLGKLNVSLPLSGQRFRAGAELQYHGSVRALSGATVDDFLLGNFVLTYGASSGLQVSGGVYNVLDEHYGYPGAEDHLQDVIIQDGRTFGIAASYRIGGDQPGR